MDQTALYIKRNIESARGAMSEKIELLENRMHQFKVMPKLMVDEIISNTGQLKGSIEEARSAIDQGLETIIRDVEEIIIKTQSTVNDIAHAGHNPWIMFGSFSLMGYAIGRFNRKALMARCPASTRVEESYR
jgi:hypothetical protein